MALGPFGRSRKVDNTTQETNVNDGQLGDATIHEKDPGAYASYDPESNNEKGGRKMSRITGAMGDSETDSQDGVGKQLELESTNSIKYRTCTWQKVHLPTSSLVSTATPRLSTINWTPAIFICNILECS